MPQANTFAPGLPRRRARISALVTSCRRRTPSRRTEPDELEFVGLHLRSAFTDLARGAETDRIARRMQHSCGALHVQRVAEKHFRIEPRGAPYAAASAQP